MMGDFLEALRFLTVLPIPGGKKEGDLARSMFFFPLVGLLIGLLSLAVVRALSLDAFVRLEALALVTLPVLLTGGLHLDGFADFCDGFFGGKDKGEVLRIMRDSRIGAWGTLGLVLLLFWKWELLASLPRRGEVLLLSLVASRWVQVVLAYFLPYANPEGGLGEKVAKRVRVRELVGASAFLTVLVLFTRASGVLAFLALIPFLWGAGWFFKRRVGGITGDLLGAASEASEVFVLFVLFLVTSGSYR